MLGHAEAGGGVTPARSEHLLRMIASATSLDELEGMRKQLSFQQELTGDVYAAMQRRVDALARTEGISPAKWWRHG